MMGYYNNPSETKSALKSRRLHTGDMGYLDKNGYLFIVDRLKDVIIVNGFNVYPREVEELLYEHVKVKEAAVIGVEDQRRGQAVKAVIVLRQGESLDEEALRSFLKKRLANYKVPTQYTFVEALPKTMIGKIDKKALVASKG
jgi:long-chain acyl-CoA synthetase